jgi:hypothetical protein
LFLASCVVFGDLSSRPPLAPPAFNERERRRNQSAIYSVKELGLFESEKSGTLATSDHFVGIDELVHKSVHLLSVSGESRLRNERTKPLASISGHVRLKSSGKEKKSGNLVSRPRIQRKSLESEPGSTPPLRPLMPLPP